MFKPADRVYSIGDMAEETANGIVDVEKFCADRNMRPTGLMVQAPDGVDSDVFAFVDLVPLGQDNRHHYQMPFFTGWLYELSVKRIILATTTAQHVWIFGINPS